MSQDPGSGSPMALSGVNADGDNGSRRPTFRTQSKGLSQGFEPYRRPSQTEHGSSKSGPPPRPPLRRKSTSNTHRQGRLLDPRPSPPMTTWSDVLYRYVTASDQMNENGAFSPSPSRGTFTSVQAATSLPAVGPDFDLESESRKTVRALQEKQCEQILEDLKSDTREYLENLFWTHHNVTLPTIRRHAFVIDFERRSGRYYSALLHIALLAVGLRFADVNRSEVRDLILAGRESRLHRAVFLFAQAGNLRDDGVPYLQALVLLAELEFGCGRPDSSRMFFDKVLALQTEWERSRSTLSFVSDDVLLSREMGLRLTKLLLARYFQVQSFVDVVGRGRTGFRTSPQELRFEDIESQIFCAQLDLEHLSSSLQWDIENQSNPSNSSFDPFSRQLEHWFDQLPESLKWTPQNIECLPMGFFILHQQYYYETIRLNRLFSQIHRLDPKATTKESSSTAESMCHKSAVRITQIMLSFNKRFRFRVAPAMAVQHAGLAGSVLLVSLGSGDSHARAHALSQFDILDSALVELSPAYEQADRLLRALKAHLAASQHQQGFKDHAQASLIAPSSNSIATTSSASASADGQPAEADHSIEGQPHRISIQVTEAKSEEDAVMRNAPAIEHSGEEAIHRASTISAPASSAVVKDAVNVGDDQETEEPAESWGRTLGAVRAAMPQAHDPTLNELFGHVFQFRLVPRNHSL